jgi:hypothetical protein
VLQPVVAGEQERLDAFARVSFIHA